jgi:hypothetical protein
MYEKYDICPTEELEFWKDFEEEIENEQPEN